MNLILTLKCNNHCAYCFQNGNRNYKDMTLEMLEAILQWSKCPQNQNIKLLGGEPTLYPNLSQAFALINKYYPLNSKTLVTNLLGTEHNMGIIYKEVQNNELNILINSTTDQDKQNLLLDRIYKLTKINPSVLSLSITFTQNDDINQRYINHFYNLIQTFPTIKKIRIGAQIPNPKQKFNKYNYDLIFTNFLDNMPRQDLERIKLDCGLNKCILSDKFFQNQFLTNIAAQGCGGPPMDLMPDGSSKYCFASCDNYVVKNIFDFPNYNMLLRYFYSMELSYKIQNNQCLNCKHYINGNCFPCHAIDEAWNK